VRSPDEMRGASNHCTRQEMASKGFGAGGHRSLSVQVSTVAGKVAAAAAGPDLGLGRWGFRAGGLHDSGR